MNDGNSDPRLYRQIAAAVKADIKNGVLAPGERLPSITELSEKHSLSRRTCGHAMRILADERLIERVPGLGYFVSRG